MQECNLSTGLSYILITHIVLSFVTSQSLQYGRFNYSSLQLIKQPQLSHFSTDFDETCITSGVNRALSCKALMLGLRPPFNGNRVNKLSCNRIKLFLTAKLTSLK